MFSGPSRAGEYSSWVTAAGRVARDWDVLRDPEHNLLHDAFFHARCEDADRGLVAFLLGGAPCRTWSVANLRTLRPEGEPEGAEEGLSPDQRARVGDANVLLERLCILALKVWHQRGGFVLEHPAARNIFGTPFYWPLKAHYSSIREMLCVRALVAVTGAVWVFAPHCAFADADGGPGEEEGVGMGAQKWSMYLIAREALACFPRLRSATCRHSGHSQHA